MEGFFVMHCDTTELSFFHGTSDLSAAKIIREGAKCILDEMDVWNASKDIWSAILRHTNNEWWQTGRLFDDAGSNPDHA
jgi:hypothetical protein